MAEGGTAGTERLAALLARLEGLVDWEKRKRGGAMRVSVAPARDLCARLGDPQRELRVVHVAGSKGKGSVSALVAAGLTRAGLRTARYASPHVERLHERFVLDGREVGDELLCAGLERALAAREAALASGTPGSAATWFDLVTAAALWMFREAGARWLVAEVGLGGRLDSTNVLSAEVCVVTTIELEHTAVLGATRAAIAAEKAGILDPGTTLVTGVPAGSEAGEVIDAHARRLGVPVLRPPWLAQGTGGRTIEARNAALAELVLEELGRRGVRSADGRALGAWLLDPATVAEVRLPARKERFEVRGVPVVLDGAHTPESVTAVLSDLEAAPPRPGKPVLVLGLARDKDLAGILKALAGRADRVLATSVGSELHLTPEEVAGAAAGAGMEAETAPTPPQALERALAAAGGGRWVLILGSLYLAGALRPLLRRALQEPACSPSSRTSS